MFRLLLIILTFTCCSALSLYGEDSLDEAIKKTDMSNADSVYALGEWCEQNNKPSTARRSIRE
jgi:hypothetical protein